MFKEARWDRQLPSEGSSFNEKISVSAIFTNGKIKPRYFIWKDRLIKIKRINYYWQEAKGSDKINLFSVNAGIDNYQISFNPNTFNWYLERIIS
ncbi:MAG: hypothetical protein P9L96_01405 [Candidatus Gygaella obscura]|nr:hypothetical protein [Candidatus Gygaella obscura]